MGALTCIALLICLFALWNEEGEQNYLKNKDRENSRSKGWLTYSGKPYHTYSTYSGRRVEPFPKFGCNEKLQKTARLYAYNSKNVIEEYAMINGKWKVTYDSRVGNID